MENQTVQRKEHGGFLKKTQKLFKVPRYVLGIKNSDKLRNYHRSLICWKSERNSKKYVVVRKDIKRISIWIGWRTR